MSTIPERPAACTKPAHFHGGVGNITYQGECVPCMFEERNQLEAKDPWHVGTAAKALQLEDARVQREAQVTLEHKLDSVANQRDLAERQRNELRQEVNSLVRRMTEAQDATTAVPTSAITWYAKYEQEIAQLTFKLDSAVNQRVNAERQRDELRQEVHLRARQHADQANVISDLHEKLALGLDAFDKLTNELSKANIDLKQTAQCRDLCRNQLSTTMNELARVRYEDEPSPAPEPIMFAPQGDPSERIQVHEQPRGALFEFAYTPDNVYLTADMVGIMRPAPGPNTKPHTHITLKDGSTLLIKGATRDVLIALGLTTRGVGA